MERLEAAPPCAFLKIFSLVFLIENQNCVPTGRSGFQPLHLKMFIKVIKSKRLQTASLNGSLFFFI